GQLQDPDGFVLDPNPETPGSQVRMYEGKVAWEQKIVIRPDATPGKVKVAWPIVHMGVCDERGCFNGDKLNPEAELTITDAPPQAIDPQYRDAVQKAIGGSREPTKPPLPAN